MSSAENIWNEGKGKLPEEKLTAYLEGRLSPEEQHEVERWLSEEGMESDGLEGLQQMGAGEAKSRAATLNKHLQHQLAGKKRRRREPIKTSLWIVIAAVVILVIVVLAYLVIHMSVKK